MSSKLKSAFLACMLFGAFSLVGCGAKTPTADIQPHLISTPDSSPVRPIDGFESVELSTFSGTLSDEQYRDRVDELYSIVVDDGKKPIFKSDDPVKAVYDGAINILDKYILNKWQDGSESGERSIVHTIHDYLITNVTYDFELFDSSRNDENLKNNPAFYIDGVFLNGRAVCDGLARAVNFLCAIEGIESMRVTGSYASGPHAWNKVKIGGKWYNIDVTADSANYTVNGGYEKQISHGFFMLSDDSMRRFQPQAHVFDTLDNIALEDYSYYADKTVTVGEAVYPSVISSQAMLNNLFADIYAQKRTIGKIEVQLSFPDKANINAADMYASEIAEAYRQIKDADFSITNSTRPYFQYPNGVYMFLIYL